MSGRNPQLPQQNPPEPIPDDPRAFLVELLRRNFIYYSVAARRESILAVGGYDERLWVGEDWELWLRLAAAGFRFAFVPQLLGLHRKRDGSLTSTLDRLLEGRRRGLPRRRGGLGRDPEIRELALSMRQQRDLRGRRRAEAAELLRAARSAAP